LILKGGIVLNTHIVNEFNEVIPVKNGRISNDTNERRNLTDFEVELLEEIGCLKGEIKRLEEIERMYNDLCK